MPYSPRKASPYQPVPPCRTRKLRFIFRYFCAAVLFTGLVSGCGEVAYQQMQGQTMGTYYAIQLGPAVDCAVAQDEVEGVLRAVNDAMSTYQADSELSRFNQSTTSAPQEVSADLYEVLGVAEDIWRRSAGAFDVTVGPLVNLWGFGPGGEQAAPDEAAQAAAASKVGMRYLALANGRVSKTLPELYVDLSALAKGYGVDQIANLLRTRGCTDFMVDVGGEISVSGVNPSGSGWRIGIEVPDPQALGMLQEVVQLEDISIATSGDYRNYRVVDGQRVDHVLDPRSGRPADNRVVSATVLHPSAMWADAYATTLMVLGREKGMAFAEQEGFAAYIIVRKDPRDAKVDAEQAFESSYNAAMSAYLN